MRLDYTTENPRWGKTGIVFDNLYEYAKTLGFLSNISHYESIKICREKNEQDGAWEEEYRIKCYKLDDEIKKNLENLYNASSKGVGNIKCRINSNSYIKHLLENYEFYIKQSTPNEYTEYIYPRENNKNLERLLEKVGQENLGKDEISKIKNSFLAGYHLIF